MIENTKVRKLLSYFLSVPAETNYHHLYPLESTYSGQVEDMASLTNSDASPRKGMGILYTTSWLCHWFRNLMSSAVGSWTFEVRDSWFAVLTVRWQNHDIVGRQRELNPRPHNNEQKLAHKELAIRWNPEKIVFKVSASKRTLVTKRGCPKRGFKDWYMALMNWLTTAISGKMQEMVVF